MGTLLKSMPLLCLLLGTTFTGYSQSKTDTIDNYSTFQRKFTLKSLIVGRYVTSLDKHVDYSGQHFINPEANNQQVVSNSFELQYARLSTGFKINDRFSSSILVNLADFKNDDVSTKVLENAFVTYSRSSYLNVRLGQFRPYFGLEDLHPFQLDNSYKWSNQYSLFGKNGWQSFQTGAAIYGNLTKKNIPFYYYLTTYNGNNKNQAGDNDSSKNYTLRFEYFPIKQLQLGVNAGVADYKGDQANAYGVDAKLIYPINDLWEIDVNAEYKQGTNFTDFRSATITDPNLSDYRMEGFYSLLKLRYKINTPRIRSIDFSFRQEYLDSNINQQGDILRDYVPMLSMVFSGNYDSKISLVGVFNDYQTNIPGTKNYDNTLFLIQYQIAFQ